MSPDTQALIARVIGIGIIVMTILISADAFGDWRRK